MNAHQQFATRAARLRLPWLTMAGVGAAVAAALWLPSPLAFAYLPEAPSLHRLLGCHFVHFSTQHLVWDVLTFALVSGSAERLLPARHAAFLVCSLLLVPPAACALTPWIRAYAGLSGLVLGQVALVVSVRLRSTIASGSGAGLGYLALLLLLFAKQLYEYKVGNTSLVTMDYRGFATTPAAHLVSVLIGGLLGMLPQRNARLGSGTKPAPDQPTKQV
jgi:membrane associated rhomboid family serine protease